MAFLSGGGLLWGELAAPVGDVFLFDLGEAITDAVFRLEPGLLEELT